MQIPGAQGHAVPARLFSSDQPARGWVVIAPAMGAGQSYYEPFAEWLQRQHYRVLTFDYRGIGAARPSKLAEVQADILDWARQDCGTVLHYVAARAGDLPITWIGHSLGAQILPFVPGRERIAKVISVASGSGYWKENSPGLRWKVWWLWYVLVPLSLRLLGYFPGKRLRKVGDLPGPAMAQWRRWCLHPDYAVGVEGESARALYASVTTPIVSLSFTDDEFMSARNIESLHSFYSGAPRTMVRLSPQQLGVRRIGHFGFFRRRFADLLWRDVLLPQLA